MEVFFVVFVVMLILVGGMAVGVIFGKKPISGSCGGMSALGMDVACDICKGDKEVCETEQEKSRQKSEDTQSAESLYYNAAKVGKTK